jgi:hypothetical protein
MIVTGFVPLEQNRQLTADQFRELGGRLVSAVGGRVHVFDEWPIADCWAYHLLQENPGLMPSCPHPPQDRFTDPQHMTLSNIIMLQKFEWMRLAAEAHPEAAVLAWVDYGIFKQHGVTAEVLSRFADALEQTPCEKVTLPGCRQKSLINDAEAHWRFLGSSWVCPRHLVPAVADAVTTVASLRAKLTGRLSWDMNTMAYVELLDMLPIHWYQADHDETQFTRYGA